MSHPPPRPGHSTARRHWLQQAGGGLAGAWLAARAPQAAAQLPSGDKPDASPPWVSMRALLFGQRPILAADPGALVLDAPSRAVDAAVVPIALRARGLQTTANPVRRLMLLIDSNPSPLGLTVQFSADAGRPDLETRVRIDAYSHVRAIAELQDGTLYMSTRYVKASGGCSAPAAGDAAQALARLGQMRLQVEGPAAPDQAVAVQLQVSHPNHSGMAMDQLTRQFTPAHFVRQIAISLGGRPLLQAQVDFSISENPFLRFYLPPRRGGELLARIVDTEDRHFSASQSVAASPA